jgi:citrate lyase beta subunit
VAFEGEMIDRPIVERARRLIARAGTGTMRSH